LIARMVGRAVAARPRREHAADTVALAVTDLSAERVTGATLTVRRGEVVGLAGLVGAGRSALLEVIAGLRRPRRGRVEAIPPVVLVPEDRGRNGLVSTLCVRENICLPAHGWIEPRAERRQTRAWIDQLAIRTAGTDAPVTALSGGNQQKVLLARALRRRPALLLLDEPTAGVDVGAKAEIHAAIGDLARSGTAILLASSDLPELLQLCDRTYAMRAGSVVGELAPPQATETRLAALITGTK
jgi:ABC-type sugar transport system ATPase subunit